MHILFKYFTHLQLAEAGFYHCPTKEEPDAVRCFFCMKELDGWEPDDDPWYMLKHLPLTRNSIYCIFAFRFKFLFDNFETGVTILLVSILGLSMKAIHRNALSSPLAKKTWKLGQLQNFQIFIKRVQKIKL